MDFELREGVDAIDFDRVHPWLASTYWSPGIEREKVERAADGASLVVSAYSESGQVGYLRIVSDRATFAWVCDVFVAPEARGHGLAKRMLRYALEHPDHQGLRRWMLATADAHEIYRACGFTLLEQPERYMALIAGKNA
ncbi:MAG: GNAT family N-acetyltransferase [Fimbriimonas sp.]